MVERSQQIKIEKLLNKHAIQSATSATITEATTGTYTIVLGKKPTSHALGMEVSEQWQSFKAYLSLDNNNG